MKFKTIPKRMLALMLCILTFCSLIPAASVMAASQVTIDSTDVTDYFIYLSGSGTWEDLNTPQHYVVETGDVAYCIQHKMDNPHSRAYSSYDPTDDYSTRTIRGLQIILDNGYPCSSGGFTAAQARYATANAIRFWLSEEGADGQWNFTNRVAHPNSVKPKSGYDSLLAWADSLVALARNQTLVTHSVTFSPASMTMKVSGEYFVGTTTVSLVNCSGGYTIADGALPTGTVITGFTGRNGDVLTIKVPVSNGNKTLNLAAVGYDNRTTANLFWYAPSASSYQKVIAFATGSYAPTANANLRMTTPAYGKIQITKTDAENGAKLAGAVFGVYSNASCTSLVTQISVGSNGVGTSGDLTAGTYYVKEITAPSGYVLNSKVYTVSLGTTTYTMTVPNTPQTGRINVTKTNGNVALGSYSLKGAVFDILSGGTVVDTLVTDAEGKAVSKALALGTYTVRERTAPTGFVAAADKTATLSPGNQTATVVYGNVTVPNMPQTGKMNISKVNGSPAMGDYSLAGAVFDIYKGSTVVASVTTDAQGKGTSAALPLGSYTVKERKAPTGFVVSDETKNVTLSYGGQNVPVVYENVSFTNNPQTGKVRVTKTNANSSLGTYPLSGAVFTVKNTVGTIVDTITTNASGVALSKELPLGTYTVQEITAPTGFILNGAVKTVTLTYGSQTVEFVYGDVTVPNTPQSGMITVEKINTDPTMGDYSLSGAVFDVFRGNTVVDTITTAANGKATTKALPLGAYTIRERTAPNGFVLSKDAATVTLEYAGQTVTTVYGEATIGNKPQVGTISVTKSDAETGKDAQGDASLYGAKYEIKNSAGKVVDTITALGSRVATSKELPLGTYTVTETEPPTGYLLNSAPQTVTLSYGGQNVEVVTQSTGVKDTVIKGKIALTKFGSSELNTSDTDPDIKPPLQNIVFEIRLKSSGALYDTLTTDAEGRAESNLLPYGTYIVTETIGAEGYLKIKPFEVFVGENGRTYNYLLEDDTVEMMIKLVKQDKTTGKTIPVAGTTFRIEDNGGKPVTFEILYPQPHTLAEFVTDESGTLYLPAKLAYGSYKLVEAKAPSGYLLGENAVSFNVSEDNAENGVITVAYKNEAVMGTITIEKSGEMLAGYTEKTTEYGTQYISTYETRGLPGAVFEVFAAENIGTPDGTVYHRAGEKVCELTTGPDGKAATGKLYLGQYNVIEKSVPAGYVRDTTPHGVTLSYKDQNTVIVTEIIGLENQRQKASVEITKLAEFFDYDKGTFYTDYGEGFVFGVYTKAAIGTIPVNALMDILTTDKDGKAVTTADLPLGEYAIRELKTPHSGYIPVSDISADLSSKNDSDTGFIIKETIENKLYKRKMSVIKVDAADGERKLEGAVFEVCSSDGKKVISTFKTDVQGYGESAELPLGKYLLREQLAPTGFVLSDEITEVTLSKDSPDIISFTFKNTEVKGRISIEKTGEQLTGFTTEDTKYGTKHIPVYENKGLSDVVFEVYAAEDIVSFDGIEYYKAGTKVCELTTGEDGRAITGKLPLGKYTVVEKSVPAGYVLDTSAHDVSLVYADQVTPIVTEILGITNGRQKAHVEISKTAEYFNPETAEFYTDHGAGFVFGLYTKAETGTIPADALMDILVTGKDGTAESSADLPLGEYYLMELAAPTGGYVQNSEKHPIDVKSKNNSDADITDSTHASEPIENTMIKKRIAVIKTDAADSERRLESAVFEVLSEDGKTVITEFTTNSKGYGESCELPLGKYILREKQAPTGFVLTDELIPIEIKADSEDVVTISVRNKATEVILEKTDITTSEALPGATITVYDEAGKVVFTDETNLDGAVVIRELPAGTYTWKETIAPVGFAINVAEFCFSIDEHGNVTGDTDITDEPITVRVKKMNSYTGKPMPGVEFTLLNSEGNPVSFSKSKEGWYLPGNGSGTFVVDANGEAEIRYLPVGDYTLVEKTPAGFVTPQKFTLNITDEYGTDNPYSVVIYNTPTAFRLYKLRAYNEKPLTGAGFTFKTKGLLFYSTLKFNKLGDGLYEISATGKEDKLMVSAAGELNVIGLPLGEVWCEESVVPKGFFPIAAFKIEITDDCCVEEPLKLTVKNDVFVKLGLDSDKYDWLWMMLGGVGIAGLSACLCVYLARRKKRNLSKNESEEN